MRPQKPQEQTIRSVDLTLRRCLPAVKEIDTLCYALWGPLLRPVGPTNACHAEVRRDKSVNNSRGPEGGSGAARAANKPKRPPRVCGSPAGAIGLNDVDERRLRSRAYEAPGSVIGSWDVRPARGVRGAAAAGAKRVVVYPALLFRGELPAGDAEWRLRIFVLLPAGLSAESILSAAGAFRRSVKHIHGLAHLAGGGSAAAAYRSAARCFARAAFDAD